MPPINWIRDELSRRIPHRLHLEDPNHPWVDLNGDRRIQPNERVTDVDRNASIGDEADWADFLRRNGPQMRGLGGIFRWSQGIRPDNPIHQLLSLDAARNPRLVQRAYTVLQRMIGDLRAEVSRNPNLSPEDRHRLTYGITSDRRYSLPDLASCWRSHFVHLALTHEMGWPVRAVRGPTGMIFFQWEESGDRIYFNLRSVVSVETLRRYHPSAIERGIYLRPLTNRQLISDYYVGLVEWVRGDGLPRQAEAIRRNRWQRGALAAYNRAIEIDPSNIAAFSNRAYFSLGLNRRAEALADAERVVELDPDMALYRAELGAMRFHLGQYQAAIADCTQALSLIPPESDFSLMDYRGGAIDHAHYVRARAELELGLYQEALADLDQCEPGNEYWQQLRRRALEGLRRAQTP